MNKANCNYKELENLLYNNLPQIEEKMLNSLPPDEQIEYQFSIEFEYKINKLIKKQEKNNSVKQIIKITKKIAIVFLIILTSVITITIKTEAFPENIMRVIKKVYQEFTNYSFINPNKSNSSIKYLYPRYIPNGYKEIERNKDQYYFSITYKNDSDKHIIYQMIPINANTAGLDTENAIIENIKFNNHNAQYVKKERMQQLLWNDKENVYMLYREVLGKNVTNKDKKEIIKIAKSIK